MNTRTFLSISILALIMISAGSAVADDHVYVVNSYVHGSSPTWSTVAKLEAEDLSLVETLQVYDDANSIAITPDQSRLWVTCPPINYIVLIDTETFEMFRLIGLGDIIIHKPMGVAITPDGETAYVTYNKTGKLGIWTAHEGVYIDRVDIGGNPDYITFTPDGVKAYVVDYENVTVTVVDTTDNTVMDILEFDGFCLQDAVISPDGSRLYVSNMQRNQIEVVRTSDNTILTPIVTEYNRPRGINISPNGQYLFVGHYLAVDALVTMIRLSDEMVVDTAYIPSNPRRIAVNTDGTRIYVTEHNEDEVYAYNVSGETLEFAAVQDLNTEPGYLASPVGIVVSEDPAPCPDKFVGGDFNGDGSDDLAGLNSSNEVFYTTNLSTWNQVPGDLRGLAVGDFDGNGKDDLAGLNSSDEVFYTTNLSTWNQVPGNLHGLTVGDFNGDGKDDLAGLNASDQIYYTTNMSTWTQVPGTIGKLVSGDFNNDGQDDLAGLNSAGLIYYTTNLATWNQVPGALNDLIVGDFNNDGADGLAGLNAQGFVYYTNNLTSWTQVPGTIVDLLSADLNGDGASDLAGLNSLGYIYYTTDLSTWNQVPGTLANLISGNLDGTDGDDLAGLNDSGNIFYTTDLSSWTQIPGKLAPY